MRVLVEFCLKIFFPSCFKINPKRNSKITKAAVNYFRMLKRIDQFSRQHARDIALSTFIRNDFLANPENIILSMLADDDKIIRYRYQEVEIVLSRGSELTPDNANPKAISVCKFIIPEINVEANFYKNILDFDKVDVTKSPATKMLNDGTWKNFKIDKLEFAHLCHNQAVERHVVGFKIRNGMIR